MYKTTAIKRAATAAAAAKKPVPAAAKKPVRFNASEIGEITGLLSQYRPNDSLPRLVCRDSFAYLAQVYDFRVPIKTRGFKSAGDQKTEIADKVGSAVASKFKDASGSVSDVLESELRVAATIEKSAARALESEAELERMAAALPLFADRRVSLNETVSALVSEAMPEPAPVSEETGAMDIPRGEFAVPETPANSVSTPPVPIPVAPGASAGIAMSVSPGKPEMHMFEIEQAKLRRKEQLRSVLETIAKSKSRVSETIQKKTYTRHGTRTENETLRRIEAERGVSIEDTSTIGVTLDPEQLLDRFGIYTDTPIRITGRPDGYLVETGQFVEVKNRVNHLTGKPRRYELPQVLTYGLMAGASDDKPPSVLFIEMLKKTGEIRTADIEYTDSAFAPYIRKLVRLAEYITNARESPEELKVLAAMDAEALTAKTAQIVDG